VGNFRDRQWGFLVILDSSDPLAGLQQPLGDIAAAMEGGLEDLTGLRLAPRG
jgi:hypothetical protein